jgi:hypothetical protein
MAGTEPVSGSDRVKGWVRARFNPEIDPAAEIYLVNPVEIARTLSKAKPRL